METKRSCQLKTLLFNYLLTCKSKKLVNNEYLNQKWLAQNPDYYKNYRQINPEKADRNRALQRIRNNKKQPVKAICIAKMDVRKSRNQSILGQFWLVPAIAKMDPIKIFITTVKELFLFCFLFKNKKGHKGP